MDYWKLPMADLAEDSGASQAVAAPAQAEKRVTEPLSEPGPAGLLRDIKDGKFLNDEAKPKAKQASHGGPGAGERGWLPKAEYEAKKREERWRSAGKEGASGPKGGGKRGWSSKGWVDIPVEIPERPAPVAETAEVRAAREAEERRMSARDALRAATTVEELRAAVATAKELGLRQEVEVGERKLAKMEG
mmetsp:Transcript_17347/g.37945  ORF Transcript_17347/g.37945 Transcript_17347/m.37945 type:complete len:190 (-) Transcript_17347:323-892(-)